jgi:hypothetical protein
MNYSNMSESRYESADEASVGNNSTVCYEDAYDTSINGQKINGGDANLVSGGLDGMYFTGNTPQGPPKSNRLSFFSMKQFDPLLKTPGRFVNGKSTGLTPDLLNKLGHISEGDSPSTPPTARTNEGQLTPVVNDFGDDRLIAVTPANFTVNNRAAGVPSTPVTSHENVVSVRVNGGSNGRDHSNGHNSEHMNQMVLALQAANNELMERFLEILEVKEREQQQLMERWTQEKDQATEDLRGAETSFNGLHGRYERLKGAFNLSKQNEEQAIHDRDVALQEVENLKAEVARLTKSLESAQEAITTSEAEKKKANSSRIQVQRLELKVSSLETQVSGLTAQLKQKTDENEKLICMVDELQS